MGKKRKPVALSSVDIDMGYRILNKMIPTLQKLLSVMECLGRCPLCGRIPKVWYSSRSGKSPKTARALPSVQERKLAERVATIVQENSENKDGVLVENNPGGPYLSKAFKEAGFRIIVADGERKKTEDISETSDAADEVIKGNIFSIRHMTTLQSDVEDTIAQTLPQRFWPDDPVVSVFSILPSSPTYNLLLLFLIRKLSVICGLYTAGRVEWFLFVSPSKARTLLCGSGDGPKGFYYPSGAMVNALYDIKLCMSVSPTDFMPRFNTGQFQKQVKVGDTVLVKDMVPLMKLVPKRDLYISIPSHEIWPFFQFLRQIIRKRNERIIPLMERFVHGCGLKMIDMGYTMVDEVWQVKPKQLLDLYLSTISWPEYEGSILHSHLKEKVSDITDEQAYMEMADEQINLDTSENDEGNVT